MIFITNPTDDNHLTDHVLIINSQSQLFYKKK